MVDNFSSMTDSVASPARQMFAITPSDSAPLSLVPKAIRANTAGTVVLRALDSTSDVTLNLIAGEVVAVRAYYVRATGTSATLHGFA